VPMRRIPQQALVRLQPLPHRLDFERTLRPGTASRKRIGYRTPTGLFATSEQTLAGTKDSGQTHPLLRYLVDAYRGQPPPAGGRLLPVLGREIANSIGRREWTDPGDSVSGDEPRDQSITNSAMSVTGRKPIPG
jgi:hypothetical protein